MQKYVNDIATVVGGSLAPLASASCAVYLTGTTTLASLYSDNGVTALTNPTTSSDTGRLQFYAADGRYDIVCSKSGYTTTTITDVLLEDPANAGDLMYLSSGTGAVTRSIQGKLRETVSVTDFGAVGDGVTDDTAAIQAAFTYAYGLTNGGQIFFPPGIYQISSTISTTLRTDASITVFGAGKSSQLRLISGSSVNLMTFTAATGIYGAYVTVRDLGFVQPSSGTSNGIFLNNANSALIERCAFFNQNAGITLTSSYNVRINESAFFSCAYGITTASTGTNHLVVSKCQFNSCTTVGVNLGVGGNNIVIRDSDLEGNVIAIGMTAYTSVLINGNYIENGTNVAFFFGGTNYQIEISQNWLGYNYGVTTPIQNTVGAIFKGNTVYNSTWTFAGTDVVAGYNYVLGTGSVGATTWTSATLASGFTQQVNYYTAQYIKDADGWVSLRGNLQNGSAGSTIFTLPSGYLPLAAATFATASSVAPGTSIIEVQASGIVKCIARDASGGTGLNGIRFKAEA